MVKQLLLQNSGNVLRSLFTKRKPLTWSLLLLIGLLPLSTAWAQVPIVYYDFENNTTRTTFENFIEQGINNAAGTGALTTINANGAITSVAGAGIFEGGTVAGTAITRSDWDENGATNPANPSDYYQFVVSTSGFSGIFLEFDEQRSGSGPSNGRILYSTNGTTFTPAPTSADFTITSGAWGYHFLDLTSVTAIDNQASVTFRIYGFGATNNGGTFRLDNLAVHANSTVAGAGTKTLLDETNIYTSSTSGLTGSVFNRPVFTVTGAGTTVRLSSNMAVSTSFSVSNSATFGFGFKSGTPNNLIGAGSFTANSGTTLEITSTAGITSSGATGNVQVTGTRTFNAGANYTYNGTANQATGNGLPATLSGNLTINNAAGATLSQNTTTNGTLNIANGVLTTGANVITANGTVTAGAGKYVLGNLQKPITNIATSKVFEVGNGTAYTPLTITFTSVTTNGNVTVNSSAGDHSQIGASCFNPSKSVNNTWKVTNAGVAPSSYDVTLGYTAGITDGSTTPANFKLGIYNGGWTYVTPTTSTSTALTATGLSTFGDMQVGEFTPTVITTQPVSSGACTGTNKTFTVAATGVGITYAWQESTDGGLNFNPLSNGGVYSGVGTGSLTITGATVAMSGYQYRAVVTSTCEPTQNSNIATLTVHPLPTTFSVSGGGAYCSGGTGVSVNLSGSQAGFTYNLIRSGATVASLTGTGSALAFTGQTTAGTYTVEAVSNTTPGCPQTMTGSASVTVNPLPTTYNVTGGGGYCTGGTGVTINLSNSQAGYTYNLILSGSTVATLTGSGSALAFTNQTTAGTYTIEAISTATPACNQTMNGSATVTINPLPAVFNVTGGGTACGNGSFAIGLDGSESGVNYRLFRGATQLGTIPGTGSALSFGNQSTAGTYTVVAINASTTCTQNMTGSAVITINPLPTAQILTGGGADCAGGPGVEVGLASSESGVEYQLKRGATLVGSPVAGTGSAITFGFQTVSGNYNYIATNTTTTCSITPNPVVAVTINPLPIAYTVTGGGTVCVGSSAAVGLSDSQNGVNYELFLDGSTTGITVSGTGTPISFGAQSATGTYTVEATNASTTCTNTMSGSVSIATTTTTTWTGNVSTDWNNPANWSNCVPSAGIDAVIPAGRPRYPVVSTTGSVYNLTINTGATVTVTGTLTINGELINNGTFTNSGASQVNFSGTAAQQIGGSSDITFINVTFNGSGPYTANSDMTVNGTITMSTGILTFSTGTALTLGTSASIVESDTSYIIGNVTAARLLTLANEDFGGLGLEIDANGVAPGLTTVTRTTGSILTGQGTSESIERYFVISAAVANGLDATVIFHYLPHELNGIAESDLEVFRSPNLGDGFSNQHGTPSAPANQVVMSNVMGFGQDGDPSGLYTLGDGNLNPLPVVLTSFTAERLNQNALVKWTTVSEKENAGFEVAVSTDQKNFRTIGKVNAATANGRGQEYSFTDTEAGKSGVRYYRLTQIDLNGTRNNLGIRSVTFDGLGSSLNATPNPTFSSFTASVTLAEAQNVTLTLTDALGRVVSQRLVQLPAGQSQVSYELGNQSAGMYLLSAQLADKTLNVKVVKQ